MANPTYTGATYTELASGWTQDPRTGRTLIRSYHGQYDALATLESSAVSHNRRTTMEPQADGSYILRVQYGAEDTQDPNEALAETWELDGSMLEKSIWFLPKVVAAMDQISDQRGRAVVKKAATSLAAGDWKFTDDNGKERDLTSTYVLQLAAFYGMTDDLNSDDPVGTGVMSDLLDNLIKGVESFPVSNFVLRRTLLIAENASDSLKPAYDYINQVMERSVLERIERPPATLMFRLPDGYYLKQTPTSRLQSADKWQVVSEWWYSDDYSSLIYEQVV